MTAPPVLELVGVHAGYGLAEVLHGVDLRVPRGAVVALLGPNGAGKSTLLSVVSGLLRPTAGDVHLAGVHIGDASPDALVRAGLCLVPQRDAVFPNLTVEQNLRLARRAGRAPAGAVDEALDRFPRLREHRTRLAGALTGGDRRTLALARALVSDPALLLLDELSDGAPAEVVDELYDAVGELTGRGVSILVVEQSGRFAGRAGGQPARRALAIADYAVVLRGGRIVATGEPDELADVYLGGAA